MGQSTLEMPIGRGRKAADTVVDCLVDAVASAPRRTAIIHSEATLTYEELGRSVAGLAPALQAARVSGGPVALVMPNRPELTVAAFASWFVGAQTAFLNPQYTPRELRPLLTDTAPSVIVTSTGNQSAVADLAAELGVPLLVLAEGDLTLDRWRDDPTLTVERLERPTGDMLATLMFTGGTTGIPKGVNHTHRSLMTTVQGMEACWPTGLGTEVWLNVAPMFHIWGLLMGILNPVYGHASVVMAFRFVPAEVLAAMDEHRVTVFSGGPAEIYAALLAAPNFATSDLTRLRVCPGGGSRFAPSLLDRWHEATGTRIYEAFGMTEIAPITCNPWDKPPRPGSVGITAPLIELRIVDLVSSETLAVGSIGEICVRGPHLTVGYHHGDESEQRLPDGWFLTGDIGRVDEDGYLYILDRKKDMLLVGGFNVYPREIDETLMSHPSVTEAATIGVPDERKGQRPISFVVAAAGAEPRHEVLHEYCHENLVDYKRPREIITVPTLPRTPANKVDRKALLRTWTDAGPAEAGDIEPLELLEQGSAAQDHSSS